MSRTVAGFSLKKEGTKLTYKKKQMISYYPTQEISTATGVFSTSTVPKQMKTCVFCNGQHNSSYVFQRKGEQFWKKQQWLKEKC